MTLCNKEPKRAKIKAHKEIAKYFKGDMKPFFNSQRFIRENSDGSIEFSVNYTQPLEILPFIKKWAPSLEILEPKELINEYIKDLKEALAQYL